MMQNSRGIDQYRKVDVQTVTPERMIVMLYEGLVRFLGCAKGAAARNELAVRNQNLIKARNIVQGLNRSLDHNAGASFTRNLTSLYNYMDHEITEMLLDGDTNHIANVLRTLSPLLTSWDKLSRHEGRQAEGTEVSNLGSAGTNSADSLEDSGAQDEAKDKRPTLSVAI